MPPLVPIGRAQFLTYEAGRQQLIDWLYLQTIADIDRRTRVPGDRYSTLLVSGLLRKLLKDLITAVHRVPDRPDPLFRMHAYTSPTHLSAGMFLDLGRTDLLDPDAPPLAREEFLETPVGQVGTKVLTVNQVIKHFAHVEGGVHVGERDEIDAGRLLQAILPTMLEPLPTIGVNVLVQLGRVAVAACAELTPVVAERVEMMTHNPPAWAIADPAERLGVVRPPTEPLQP